MKLVKKLLSRNVYQKSWNQFQNFHQFEVKYDHQCKPVYKLRKFTLTHFWKWFGKVSVLLKKLYKSWFNEIFYSLHCHQTMLWKSSIKRNLDFTEKSTFSPSNQRLFILKKLLWSWFHESVQKQEILYIHIIKIFSWNQQMYLVTSFVKNVTFTNFLSNKCEREYLVLTHYVFHTIWIMYWGRKS